MSTKEPDMDIPESIEDSRIVFDKNFSEEDKEVLKKGWSQTHFGFGMWLRNNWGLWEQDETKKNSLVKEFNALGLYHADDLSSVLLESYHRYLNNEPINLKEQVKLYRDYWEKVQPSINAGKMNES